MTDFVIIDFFLTPLCLLQAQLVEIKLTQIKKRRKKKSSPFSIQISKQIPEENLSMDQDFFDILMSMISSDETGMPPLYLQK